MSSDEKSVDSQSKFFSFREIPFGVLFGMTKVCDIDGVKSGGRYALDYIRVRANQGRCTVEATDAKQAVQITTGVALESESPVFIPPQMVIAIHKASRPLRLNGVMGLRCVIHVLRTDKTDLIKLQMLDAKETIVLQVICDSRNDLNFPDLDYLRPSIDEERFVFSIQPKIFSSAAMSLIQDDLDAETSVQMSSPIKDGMRSVMLRASRNGVINPDRVAFAMPLKNDTTGVTYSTVNPES